MNSEQLEPSLENKEDVREYESTIRFDELDDESFRDFAKRVEESNGVVRVFIHPFHLINVPIEQKPLKILAGVASKESAPPIIVFENKNKIDWTRKSLEEEPGSKNKVIKKPIYILPTLNNYPYPTVDNMSEPKRDDKGWIIPNDYSYEYSIKGMVKFTNFIHEAGARKIVLGGSELEVTDDEIYRCVGEFIKMFKFLDRELGTAIELKVSTGTSPQGRDDLRKAGFNDLL